MFFNEKNIAPIEYRRAEYDKYRLAFDQVMQRRGTQDRLGEKLATIMDVVDHMILVQPDQYGVIEFPEDTSAEAVPVVPILRRENSVSWQMGSSFNQPYPDSKHLLEAQGYSAVNDDVLADKLIAFKKLYTRHKMVNDETEWFNPKRTGSAVVHRSSRVYTNGQEYVLAANRTFMILFPAPRLGSLDPVMRAEYLGHESIHIAQWAHTVMPISPVDYFYNMCVMEDEAFEAEVAIRRSATAYEMMHYPGPSNVSLLRKIKAAKLNSRGQKLPFIRAMNNLGVLQLPHSLLDELEQNQ